MGRTIEYTIVGPPEVPGRNSPAPFSKGLPYRKESKGASSNLRSLYCISAQSPADTEATEHSLGPVSTILPNSPYLPPTPPGATNGDVSHAVDEHVSDTAMVRSALVTPINQNSPPTPDNTPPREGLTPSMRPFLHTQPSMTSTGAESFKTAREDLDSDSDRDSQIHENGTLRPLTPVHNRGPARHRMGRRGGDLPRSPLINAFEEENDPVSMLPDRSESQHHTDTYNSNAALMASENGSARFRASPQALSCVSTPDAPANGTMAPLNLDADTSDTLGKSDTTARPGKIVPTLGLRRDQSLRDRLLEAQKQDPSASTEKFADIIGWNNLVPIEGDSSENLAMTHEDTRRLSGISATSTIGAFVFEQNQLPSRRATLRHMNKHESLRSVSSPLPSSNRNSMTSNSDSPRRLVHKEARLSNQIRWSFESEVSRSYSLASSAALPKTEIIRVAVIPERNSSLSSSYNGSHRQSLSAESARSQSRRTSDNPPSSWQHKRAFSEAVERGRGEEQGPSIPPRSSSLSAPTSRSTSRANSITSEHLRVRRQQAEKDLRKTLDRMESDRLVQNLHDWDLEDQAQAPSTSKKSTVARGSFGQKGSRAVSLPGSLLSPPDPNGNMPGLFLPGTNEWAALRPPSVLETPFSQPSFHSASPEINEAKAINFFPHNNHSLQLIEPFPVQESRAVQEVQRRNLPSMEVESPLRNPRRPPEPPQFKVIPPTPGDELEKELVLDGPQALDRTGSSRRRGNSRRRSDSLIDSISRNLSLKNARNRKANQELDGKLHPFWRPRAFWDDIDVARPELEQEQALDQGRVRNSLGLPQKRTVITGPVSLVRLMSERRRQKRGIVKQTSHGSLSKLRATRRLHKSHSLGLGFHLIGIKDIHQRMLRVKERREDDKREKRREELRRSIGPNVVSQGDSRFPASHINLVKNVLKQTAS
ncbi:hypothetical protein A1O1_06906 [Capronia coronata CBS 617.96]|uniref:Uncharacterized protein n=1 Tax=Capronia coronata CBS 617.96 TaxID=1182541 RepID=W9XRV2_9EURO|nr:uncharacterized protein A1O1_06906 [Capronia coronata CBS 617.96]EXJ83287.1 hypothetical protein A1O1_06906 [Capronia coronata CBS 617.96]